MNRHVLCITCAMVGCTLTPQNGCKLYSPLIEEKEKGEEMLKVYYAHCTSIYNTAQEERDIETLRSLGFKVVNPNAEGNTENYKKYGMKHFLAMALDCDVIAFRALPDGRIPAGVAKEVRAMLLHDKPVIELPSRISGRGISVDETREYLKEIGQR